MQASFAFTCLLLFSALVPANPFTCHSCLSAGRFPFSISATRKHRKNKGGKDYGSFKIQPIGEEDAEDLRQQGFSAAAMGCSEKAAQLLLKYLQSAERPDPAAWNCRGAMLAQMGDSKAAKSCFMSAIDEARLMEDVGAQANALFNLGNILYQNGELDAAISCFKNLLDIRPQDSQALSNLGLALSDKGDKESALSVFGAAIKVDPKEAIYWLNQANTLADLGRHVDAVVSYEEAANRGVEQNKDFLLNLGVAARRAGMNAVAVNALNSPLLKDHALAKRLLLTLTSNNGAVGEGSPEKELSAKDNAEYAAHLFDGYAETFEQDLVKNLNYNVPQDLLLLLLKADKRIKQPGQVQQDLKKDNQKQQKNDINVFPCWGTILDIGCGSGLFGALVRPYCAKLVGVDASSKMAVLAREKGVYDQVECAELVDFLRATASAGKESVDAIAAADVFCYLSDLEPAVVAAANLLQDKHGLLAFSTENIGGNEAASHQKQVKKPKNDDNHSLPGWQLKETGRYGHCLRYVREVIDSAGMKLQVERQQVLRLNGNKPIQGTLWIAGFPDKKEGL